MRETPELLVYTHRHSDWLPKLMESLARTVTVPYRVHTLIQPGSVHQNMQRVLEMAPSDSRFVCWLDEDIQFLDKDWLQCLLEQFQDPQVGMVGTAQVKTAEQLFDYEMFEKRGTELPNTPIEVDWLPAHCIMLDRSRVKSLYADVNMPGIKGMSDVDICMQVRSQGLKIILDERVVVYHPWKPDVENPSADVFPEQVCYMLQKWGDLYGKISGPYVEPVQSRIVQMAEERGIVVPTHWSK